jgi:predicted ATP-binding protein involved in virulence
MEIEMNTSIKKIKQNTPFQKRDIKLAGKNLIVVGNNGAGKTRFLNDLKKSLQGIFDNQSYSSTKDLKRQLTNQQNALGHHEKDTDSYNSIMNSIVIIEKWLADKNHIDIDFVSSSDLIASLKEGEVIFRFFAADRYYKHNNIPLLTSVESLFEEFEINGANKITTSSFFESYLVSMSNYALLEKGAGELVEYERVSSIIKSIEYDLRELFEDDELKVEFNRKRLRMEVIQNDKAPFDLEQLPSGYSSILAIYSELIMLSELSGKNKREVRGIVIIDEIDAHLHVTLQKKVFNFFSSSFPMIQFLISTHSPFVVQSVSNAVIYNLSLNEQMEDLSIYSFTSIIKGLLGETGNSDDLEHLLVELTSLSENERFGGRFEEIILILDNNFEYLDARAKAILLKSKSQHLDWEAKQDNV